MPQETLNQLQSDAAAEGAFGSSTARYITGARDDTLLPTGAIWRQVRVKYPRCYSAVIGPASLCIVDAWAQALSAGVAWWLLTCHPCKNAAAAGDTMLQCTAESSPLHLYEICCAHVSIQLSLSGLLVQTPSRMLLQGASLSRAGSKPQSVNHMWAWWCRLVNPVEYQQAFSSDSCRLCIHCLKPVTTCDAAPDDLLPGAMDLFCG